MLSMRAIGLRIKSKYHNVDITNISITYHPSVRVASKEEQKWQKQEGKALLPKPR